MPTGRPARPRTRRPCTSSSRGRRARRARHGEGGPQALAQLGHEPLRDALHRHLADGVGGGDPPLALPPLLHRELVRRHPRRG
jgi:hypothetical protein